MSNYRQCPYDPLHKIAAKTFALHLVKCKRQHPDIKLVSCHFDTSHLVKQEKLRDHMKTCSGRKDLLQYKFIVNKSADNSKDELPDPADDLIYNTAEPSRQKTTGVGSTLQDDSECWDDFAYKAYNPLENCKSKMKNGNAFIIPNSNRFAGQMQDASTLKVEQVQVDPDDSATHQVAEAESSEDNRYEERQYGELESGESSSYRSVDRQEPSIYESESAGSGSSSNKLKYKDRDLGASSSSRRYEILGETRRHIKTEERSYRSRDRSRSDSTSSSDRKSHLYDGHPYHGSYDPSRSRHRRDRYQKDRNNSYREEYDKHTDSDTSDGSYNSRKHKLQPYQRYM
ncbi:uncharacterized protein LOC128715106 [Anopheles marshallii]|uniref:uncharacterized protein LOC128715106 n=1 Tax=Anopheles marshallii TaxID=1521116 RepID=UPI00237B3948|nr:uncharacterized protein LOC128715106 [Anopheles marshallii]